MEVSNDVFWGLMEIRDNTNSTPGLKMSKYTKEALKWAENNPKEFIEALNGDSVDISIEPSTTYVKSIVIIPKDVWKALPYVSINNMDDSKDYLKALKWINKHKRVYIGILNDTIDFKVSE